VGAGDVEDCATTICMFTCADAPVLSETVIPKLKLPAALGVPVTVPVD
jgi:hypothetical protein